MKEMLLGVAIAGLIIFVGAALLELSSRWVARK